MPRVALPRKPKNADVRAHEYLTESEVTRLAEAAQAAWCPARRTPGCAGPQAGRLSAASATPRRPATSQGSPASHRRGRDHLGALPPCLRQAWSLWHPSWTGRLNFVRSIDVRETSRNTILNHHSLLRIVIIY